MALPSATPAITAAQALATESFDLWAAGCAAWAGYFTRLATAPDPVAWIEANAALMQDGLELCQRAAAARLESGHLRAPLLSDA